MLFKYFSRLFLGTIVGYSLQVDALTQKLAEAEAVQRDDDDDKSGNSSDSSSSSSSSSSPREEQRDVVAVGVGAQNPLVPPPRPDAQPAKCKACDQQLEKAAGLRKKVSVKHDPDCQNRTRAVGGGRKAA